MQPLGSAVNKGLRGNSLFYDCPKKCIYKKSSPPLSLISLNNNKLSTFKAVKRHISTSHRKRPTIHRKK